MSEKLQLRMITFSATLVLLFLVFNYVFQLKAGASSDNSSVDSLRTVRLTLEGLNQQRVDQAIHTLDSIPGVIGYELHPDEERATLTIDVNQVSMRRMCRQLEESGFTALF